MRSIKQVHYSDLHCTIHFLWNTTIMPELKPRWTKAQIAMPERVVPRGVNPVTWPCPFPVHKPAACRSHVKVQILFTEINLILPEIETSSFVLKQR